MAESGMIGKEMSAAVSGRPSGANVRRIESVGATGTPDQSPLSESLATAGFVAISRGYVYRGVS